MGRGDRAGVPGVVVRRAAGAGVCAGLGAVVNGWSRQDSHELTAALVLFDGHQVALTDPEKTAALRLAQQAGMTREQARQRLRVDAETLGRWIRRSGIVLAPDESFGVWCRRYIQGDTRRKRRRKRS